jgi:hypothetical protein
LAGQQFKKKEGTLRTADKREAERLLNAMNESHRQPTLNLNLARAYLAPTIPKWRCGTWQAVCHFVIAVWRAKEAYSKYEPTWVALRIELVHKVDDHLYPRVILLTVSLLTAICLFPYH